MPDTCDRGIIWKLEPFQETDALLTIFGRDSGKINLLAKGLRSEKSKRRGSLQVLNLVHFDYVLPKNENGLGRITKTEFISAPLAHDHIAYATFALLIEISDRFLAARQSVEKIYDLWQHLLALPLAKPQLEICGFILQFMHELGLFPDFQRCNICAEKFSAEKEIFWKRGDGVSCCEKSPLSEFAAQRLNFSEIKTLFFLAHTAPENFAKLFLSKAEQDALWNLIFSELQFLSEKPFKALKVFLEFL